MRRQQVIDARKASGLTQEQIAEKVGVDRTTLGKWERGESTPQPNQLSSYADALGISMRELAAMLNVTREGNGEIAEWLSMYLGMEQSATHIRAHEPRAIHGLFQTPKYVSSLVSRVGIFGVSESYLHGMIEQRLYRQRRVRSGDLTVDVIQPESSLRLCVGDAETMHEQLITLLELSELPNVKIRVTTFDMGQYEARRLDNFSILTHPWGTPRVHVENYSGGHFITDSEEVGYFASAFDHACRIALSPKESRKFISKLAKTGKTNENNP